MGLSYKTVSRPPRCGLTPPNRYGPLEFGNLGQLLPRLEGPPHEGARGLAAARRNLEKRCAPCRNLRYSIGWVLRAHNWAVLRCPPGDQCSEHSYGHRKHLRTSNVIESLFATLRLRQRVVTRFRFKQPLPLCKLEVPY